jgi:hypothetical protein
MMAIASPSVLEPVIAPQLITRAASCVPTFPGTRNSTERTSSSPASIIQESVHVIGRPSHAMVAYVRSMPSSQYAKPRPAASANRRR